MNRNQRAALLAVTVVVAVVAFLILKPGGDEQPKTAAPQTSAQQTQAPTQTQTTQPATAAAQRIVVRGGEPVGGVRTIKANRGERVRFTIASDVADEIHVHGYDLKRDVAAGGRVSFSFPARIEGVFEVELEQRATQIAKLVVSP